MFKSSTYGKVCFSDWKALYKATAGAANTFWFCRGSSRKRARSHAIKPGVQVSVGHSCRPLTPNTPFVHVGVSSSCVFLSNFFYPGGFNGEFAQLPIRIIFTRPCQWGSDCTYNKLHTHRYSCMKPLHQTRSERTCLSRQWAVAEFPPLEQMSYNIIWQHNTCCFQGELAAPLLTMPGFSLNTEPNDPEPKAEFSYYVLKLHLLQGY